MKKIAAIIIFISTLSFAQDSSSVFTHEKTDENMLIGLCTREAFNDSAFSWWWNSEYEMYEVDEETLSSLKDKMDEVYVTIILGTWCSDSRREVPRFFKIVDWLSYPKEKITIIAVDRDKKAGAINTYEYGVSLVPTFIFMRDGTEIGRITETPQESLEKDLTKIAAK